VAAEDCCTPGRIAIPPAPFRVIRLIGPETADWTYFRSALFTARRQLLLNAAAIAASRIAS